MFSFASSFIIGGDSLEEVLSGHFTIQKLIAFTPFNLFLNPGFAVGFFFLLSGYVLSYQYFKTPTFQLLRNNFLKRYFRLAIPVLASCILVWILHRFNLYDKGAIPETLANKNWLARLFPDNLNFLETIKYGLYDSFTGKSDYNAVLWTIYVEFTGSLLLFLFLFITHKIESKFFIFLFVIILQFIFGDNHYKAFSFGILICYLQFTSMAYKKFVSSSIVKVILVLLGLYLASFPYVSYDGTLQNTIYKHVLFFREKKYYELANVFGCSFLLIVFVNGNKLKSFFSAKTFSFLGKVSFSLYLIHLCLIPVVSARVYRFLYKYLFDYVSIPLTFIISLAFTLGLSYLFYKYIDAFAVKNTSRISKFIFRYK